MKNEKSFSEIKTKAIELWKLSSNSEPYIETKIERIKDLKFSEENLEYIISMFDIYNLKRLVNMVERVDSQGILAKRIKEENNAWEELKKMGINF